mgnify:CR=1 FL=1
MQLLLRTGFESPGPAPDSILQHGSHGQAGTHLFIKQEVLMAVSPGDAAQIYELAKYRMAVFMH